MIYIHTSVILYLFHCILFKELYYHFSLIAYSEYVKDISKMTCISRTDNSTKLFLQEKSVNRRWNLYSQVTIENNTLFCSNQAYPLTQICCHGCDVLQPCTLTGTNETVDIGQYL